MIIGVPKEIKKLEYRVGLTPDKAAQYVKHGHTVYVQKDAGIGSGYSDQEYVAIGAKILPDIASVYKIAEMIIKVKEPLKDEYPLMREGQIVYTYFHLAASLELTQACLQQKIIAIAYETIRDEKGHLPCLKPMSEVAGRLSIQVGARFLEKTFGGRGVLLSGVPGVHPGTVVVLGAAGVAGSNAVLLAVGLGAEVYALDISEAGLVALKQQYGEKIHIVKSTTENIIDCIKKADLLVSTVLIPGDAAPKLVKKEYLAMMKPGSVIVDVAIDQGGSTETSHVTYHDAPTYVVDNVIHYCVGNMPGAVPRTSSEALNNSTISYGLAIADMGYKKALRQDAGLALGLNTDKGKLCCHPVADFFKLPYTDVKELIK